MPRLTTRERFGEYVPRRLREFGRKTVERFDLALQLKPEVFQLSLERERAVLPARIVNELGLRASRILSDQLDRDLCSFDCRAWNPGSISEIAQLAGDWSPRATYTRFGNAGLGSVRGPFVDHQVEGHELREQLREFSV